MIKINISPEEDLFEYFTELSQGWGHDTYYYAPAKAKYPFVVIDSIEGASGGTKTELTGSVSLTIHCWNTANKRKTVDEMVERFFHAVIGRVRTKNYLYYGQAQQQYKRMLIDTSVPNTTLLHGVVQIELQIQ